MKELLKHLDGCLDIDKFHTKHTPRGCYISLTGGGNHKIYIPFSSSHRPLSAAEICAATPKLPVNGTKFTRISLDGECGWKNSTKASSIAPPYLQ
jgi:hypothetical protein